LVLPIENSTKIASAISLINRAQRKINFYQSFPSIHRGGTESDRDLSGQVRDMMIIYLDA